MTRPYEMHNNDPIDLRPVADSVHSVIRDDVYLCFLVEEQAVA
jgi:hypothetical protein